MMIDLLTYLCEKSSSINSHKASQGHLIILESTCPVGTSDMMINEIKFERPIYFQKELKLSFLLLS